MAHRGRGGISYLKQDEPDFIRKFKQKIGYKEGPDVDTKRQELEFCEEDRPEEGDEKPVVVVLKEGDLTAEEAERLQGDITLKDEDEPPSDGRILFKKPTKRSAEDSSESKVKKSERSGSKKPKMARKEAKMSSLLSFDEEENDDG